MAKGKTNGSKKAAGGTARRQTKGGKALKSAVKQTGGQRGRRRGKKLFAAAALAVFAAFLGEDGYGSLKLKEEGMALFSNVQSLALKGKEFFFRKAKTVSFKEAQQSPEGELIVTYLDVGQGSCAILQQDGHAMLIDGGDRETSSKVVAALKAENIEKLDYIVVSHYDSDHLSGVIGVLNTIPADAVLSPDYEAETKLYRSYLKALSASGMEEIHPSLGDSYEFGEGSFTIVGPVSYGHTDENDDSVSLRLQYGDVSFLFCGDAGEEAEEEMINAGVNLQSDVYLADHHGSRFSTSEAFLKKVDPDCAVVSCGAGNEYGHPAERVLELFQEYEVELYRTDLQGTIEAVTDGTNVEWNQAPCTDYTPG